MVSDVLQMVQRPLNYAIVDEVDSIDVYKRQAYGPYGFIGIMKRTNHSLKVEKNIFIEG